MLLQNALGHSSGDTQEAAEDRQASWPSPQTSPVSEKGRGCRGLPLRSQLTTSQVFWEGICLFKSPCPLQYPFFHFGAIAALGWSNETANLANELHLSSVSVSGQPPHCLRGEARWLKPDYLEIIGNDANWPRRLHAEMVSRQWPELMVCWAESGESASWVQGLGHLFLLSHSVQVTYS